MTSKHPISQIALKDWRLWLITLTAILYCIDIFIQAFIFYSPFESITSALLVFILGFETYSRVRHGHSYFGQTYSLVFCLLLIILLVFLYLPK